MNFASLTDQQKEYLIFWVVGVITLIVSILLGIKVSRSFVGDAKLEVTDLSSKIESAERALDKHDSVVEQFVETSGKLRIHFQNIPPKQNYYSWATENIYAIARLADLEIHGIDEQSVAKPIKAKKKTKKAEKAIKLESYSLRITARGGFNKLKNFLKLVEEGQPLMRVTGIDIRKGADPEVHDMQLFIQWPLNVSSIIDIWEEVVSKQQVVKGMNENAATEPLPLAEAAGRE